MRDEIIGGLRNAIERGATLEQAMRSFISAGYSQTEVQAAAELLSQGATTILHAPLSASKEPEKSISPRERIVLTIFTLLLSFPCG